MPSITTYAQLKTAISSWTKRDDLTSYLDDIISMAELWIYRNARVREMEGTLSITIASSVGTVPSDFIAGKTPTVSVNGVVKKLRPASADWILSQYPVRPSSEVPEFYAVQGSTMIFGPAAGSYTVGGTYYKNLGDVASSAHALFLAYPDLYLWASLAEASMFMKNDQRGALWTAKRDLVLEDINKQAKESRTGDGMAVQVA